MQDLLDMWRKARTLGEDLEESYKVTQRHYEEPPLWLVGGQVLFRRATALPFHDKLGLQFLGGYLKTRFPSFREYCMDPAEDKARNSLMDSLERIMEE